MASNGKKETYSMRARIDTMDNGCIMIIRRHESFDTPGVVVLKRVYTNFGDLVQDLEEYMKFKWPKEEK